MKNLIQVDACTYALEDCHPGSKICLNPTLNVVYNVSPIGICLLKQADSVCSSYFPEILWSQHDIKIKEIITADMVSAIAAITVVTEEGDVITVNTDSYEVECVGTVSDGITAACWSPDEELLILVTGAANVVIMTAAFDIVTELSLNQIDAGVNEFINVGWGKKETQFHGSIGKEAAKLKQGTVAPVKVWDDMKPRITWRGDGQMFAVGYVTNDESKCRKIRILNREGVILHTSEDVSGLEQGLSWKPSGSLITSTQTLPNRCQVVFIEKNGLRHGEFTFPHKPNERIVKEVLWNSDSSVLLVWLEDMLDDENKYIIHLWTTGNYHWYLKQQLVFKDKIRSVKWDIDNFLQLYVLTERKLNCYTWVEGNVLSRGLTVSDLAQVAVINDCKVNFTPFRHVSVPPPMSAYDVTFPGAVNAVIFAPSLLVEKDNLDKTGSVEDSGFLESVDPPGKNSNNVCVYYSDEMFAFLSTAHASEDLSEFDCNVRINEVGGKGFKTNCPVHRVLGKYKLNWNSKTNELGLNCREMCNWLWVSKDLIFATFRNEDLSWIVVIRLENIGSENGEVIVQEVIPVDEHVLSLASSSDGAIVVAQLLTGELKLIDVTNKNISTWFDSNNEIVKLGRACKQIFLCRFDESDIFYTIGLNFHNQLYWGSQQICSNCTSCHLYNNYLLFTTSSHQLHVVPLSLKVFTMLASNSTDAKPHIGVRKIERGARIVTAVPYNSSVVLQMPRGNIEVISPRTLQVDSIKKLLENKDYKSSIILMRKHRIDMNLIYYHNPSELLNNMELFINSVDSSHLIDLFIANLNGSDVTKTMYSVNYIERSNIGDNGYNDASNIDEVCVAIRNAMMKIDEEKYLLPILTSHVKMTNSQMDIAIKIIQTMKSSLDANIKTKAEEGLRHLLYIADANTLFDVALGTYDFQLVMMVFEKSQKDPKEFLPFLNNLKKLEGHYQKFKIDVHLRRFKKALVNIIPVCDDHVDECISLIEKENLYKDSLQIFPSKSKLYLIIAKKFAKYLLDSKCYTEAAIMFNNAGDHQEELKAYQLSGNWRRVLITASQLNYDKDQMNQLYYMLVEDLVEGHYYNDAANIYENYLKNEEDALENFVKACMWEDALRIVYKFNRLDLIETNIKPNIKEQILLYNQELDDKETLFSKLYNRLIIVRSNIEKIHSDYLDGKDQENLDCDLYSDSSTITGISHNMSSVTRSLTGSSKSGKSHRSSKSKRKLERKKHSTKEGSSFEDLGIVTALHAVMISTDELIKPVASFLPILMSFNLFNDASQIQNKLKNLLSLMDSKQKEIWLLEKVGNDSDESAFGANMTTETMIQMVQRSNNGLSGTTSVISLRMKDLDTHLQYPPQMFNSKDSWTYSLLTN